MEGDEEATVNDIDQRFSPGALGSVWGKVGLLQPGRGSTPAPRGVRAWLLRTSCCQYAGQPTTMTEVARGISSAEVGTCGVGAPRTGQGGSGEP